jgi:tight adherence protein C
MTPELPFLIAVVFVGVAVATGSIMSLVLAQRAPERRRIRALTGDGASDALLADDATLSETVPNPALQRLSTTLPKSPKEMSDLRRDLATAGYYSLKSAIYFSAAKLFVPIAAAAVVLLLLGPADGWLFALCVLPIGYLVPRIWLSRKTAQRQRKIQNGLPDALDLFVVCVEAGSSLDQAIVRASEELHVSHPEVAQELRIVTTEIRAGKPRLEALKNFSRRTQVEDVRSLVTLLVQTDRFGTSIATALRTHADTSRTKRRQRAEERAAKIGVKLVFPLVFCLFPAVYIVCIGSAVVAIYRAFF